jgi:omega-amidase
MVRVGLCSDPALLRPAAVPTSLPETDFILFPELADAGYAGLERGMPPHHAGDELLRRFSSFSDHPARYCIAGSVAFQDTSSRVTNTSLVFHRRRPVHRYDKIHLFRPTLDHRYFVPGSTVSTFEARLGRRRIRCGVVICYDLRFPELTRAMALEGMQILFVPARWPANRDEAWRTLLRARAMENQIFVVGCNARGPEGGCSYVFAPTGDCLLSSPRRPAQPVTVVSLDFTLRTQARALHRNLDEAVYLRSIVFPSRIRRKP